MNDPLWFLDGIAIGLESLGLIGLMCWMDWRGGRS